MCTGRNCERARVCRYQRNTVISILYGDGPLSLMSPFTHTRHRHSGNSKLCTYVAFAPLCQAKQNCPCLQLACKKRGLGNCADHRCYIGQSLHFDMHKIVRCIFYQPSSSLRSIISLNYFTSKLTKTHIKLQCVFFRATGMKRKHRTIASHSNNKIFECPGPTCNKQQRSNSHFPRKSLRLISHSRTSFSRSHPMPPPPSQHEDADSNESNAKIPEIESPLPKDGGPTTNIRHRQRGGGRTTVSSCEARQQHVKKSHSSSRIESPKTQTRTLKISQRKAKKEQLNYQPTPPKLTTTERILSSTHQSLFTGSVQLDKPRKKRQSKQQQHHRPDVQELTMSAALKREEQPTLSSSQSPATTTAPLHRRRTQVTTCCLPPPVRINDDDDTDDTNTMTCICIQPLLVLDLNGILCHRVRRRHGEDPLPMTSYRPQMGPSVAMTPIIPRPDLSAFLEYLNQHFCLAIWTSAKAKTAKALVNLLVPESIQSKLLFVWSQNHCQVDMPHNDNSNDKSTAPLRASDIVYKKDLGHVWEAFPLWNHSNTLLMDDSPDKCVAWEENAVHPPPLHGRRCHDVAPSPLLACSSDEENVRKQREFFQHLVRHWSEQVTTREWDNSSKSDDATEVHNGEGHLRFLEEHAVGHMGWHR